MVGWSVWGAMEISMPQGSHTKEMKFTCFPADMPYQETPRRQKLNEILCCPVTNDGDSEAVWEKRKMNISPAKLPHAK